MFKDNSINLHEPTVIDFREHLLFMLELEKKQFSVSVELRPLQILLLQGISERTVFENELPDDFKSELLLAIVELTDAFRALDVKLPRRDIPQANLVPMLQLMNELQLVEISDDDDENEEVRNG